VLASQPANPPASQAMKLARELTSQLIQHCQTATGQADRTGCRQAGWMVTVVWFSDRLAQLATSEKSPAKSLAKKKKNPEDFVQTMVLLETSFKNR
jgi:hypothetical protein